MPSRPTSHQIEDISRNEFRRLLPPQWVARDKTQDYGVDLEVEVFDTSGESTGLVFNVQLKATDKDPSKSSIKLETKSIAYLYSLDLPTLVVGYFRSNNSFFHLWHFSIPHVISDKSKTKTVRFSSHDKWDQYTVSGIETMLRNLRSFRSIRGRDPVGIYFDISESSGNYSSTVERFVECLANGIATLKEVALPRDDMMCIKVLCNNEHVIVGLPGVKNLTIPIKNVDRSSVVGNTAYAICIIVGFSRAAAKYDIVRYLVANDIVAGDRKLFEAACFAIREDIELVCELALLNNIHIVQDESYLAVALMLRAQPVDSRLSEPWISKFFLASARENVALGRNGPAASAFYSLANFYRTSGMPLPAIQNYNKARKADSKYCDLEYFWREIGGCCFQAQKFKRSRKFYRRSIELGSVSDDVVYLHSEATFQCGLIAEAWTGFETTWEIVPGRLRWWLVLYDLVCGWLKENHGDVVPVMSSRADEYLAGGGYEQVRVLEFVLTDIDALHPLANFNMGYKKHLDGDDETAAVRYLICAIRQSNDVAAWTNALICLARLRRIDIFIDIAICAQSATGGAALPEVRDALEAQGAGPDLLEAIDIMRRELKVSNSSKDEEFLMRVRSPIEGTLPVDGDVP